MGNARSFASSATPLLVSISVAAVSATLTVSHMLCGGSRVSRKAFMLNNIDEIIESCSGRTLAVSAPDWATLSDAMAFMTPTLLAAAHLGWNRLFGCPAAAKQCVPTPIRAQPRRQPSAHTATQNNSAKRSQAPVASPSHKISQTDPSQPGVSHQLHFCRTNPAQPAHANQKITKRPQAPPQPRFSSTQKLPNDPEPAPRTTPRTLIA